MKYFVSGHRDLTLEEFEKYYIPIIDNVLSEDAFAEFIVGDWEGCDLMTVEYLSLFPKETIEITIYYVENVRMRPFRDSIYNLENVYFKEKSTYDECDASMTIDSDFDIAWIRPGRENSHTANNIRRRYGL